MIYYYSLFVTFFFLSLLEKKFNPHLKSTLITISFLFLVFFAGFRSNEFGDYCTYKYFFLDSPDLVQYLYNPFLFHRHTDFGFQMLINFSKVFSSNVILMFFITALLSVSIIFFCIRKMSPYIFVSVIIYFSHMYLLKDLAQIRSGLASAFVLLSIYLVANKNIRSGVVSIVIGSLMHLSAIPTLIYVFFHKIEISKFLWICFLMISILVTAINLDDIVFQIFSQLNLLPLKFYVYYQQSSMSINNYDLGIFSNIATVKYLLVSLVSIFLYDQLNNKYNFFKPAFILYIFGTAWIIIFNDFSIFAARIASIFTVGEIILIPMIISVIQQKNIAKIVFLVIFASIFYYNVHLRGTEISTSTTVPDNPFIFSDEPCVEYNMENQWQNQEYLK